VAEENSASTQQVSASTEEMTAQVSWMQERVRDLAETAERLAELVARFRTDAAPATGEPTALRPAASGGQSLPQPLSIPTGMERGLSCCARLGLRADARYRVAIHNSDR